MRVRTAVEVLVVAVAFPAAAHPVWAHRDDYINETFVFETIARGELEPEVWYDRAPAQGGSGPAARYAAAFEYGVTPRFMVDGFAGWVEPSGGAASLSRVRGEARARFGEEGDRPVDVALSFEAEYERGPEALSGEAAGAPAGEAERAVHLTPRLVLSRDLGRQFNTTLNLDFTTELRAHAADRFSPGYAVGLRFAREALFRYGLEWRRDFASKTRSVLFPQIWVALPHDATLKFGEGLGGGAASGERLFRVVFEIEF